MPDARLRDLERRFRATGDVEDEAAWLRARVQAGDLEVEGLRLAALLRHPAARRAAHDGGPPLPKTRSALCDALRGCSAEARFRAAVAVARLCVDGMATSAPMWKAELVATVDATEDALLDGRFECPRVARPLPTWARWNAGDPESAVDHGALTVGLARVFPRLRDELVPWALGMEPPELRVKPDDVFGDGTLYRKGRR